MGEERQSSASKPTVQTQEPQTRQPLGSELFLADEMAEVSQLLVGAEDVEAMLAITCRLAVDRIPGCEAAGVLLIGRGSMRSVAWTSDTARVVDELQFRYSEGPCLDAANTDELVKAPDLLTCDRWPSFGPAAVEVTGVRTILAHRLRAGTRTLGALNLYSTVPQAFDRTSGTSHLAVLFASHAAVALAGAQALEGLRTALESRETISVAMGIMMARQRVSRAEAFDVLRRASQRENVKLRDIAARIAGGVDDVVPPPE